MKTPTGRRLAIVLVFFGAAYFLSLFFRSVNAIIAPNLTQELGLGPADLGLLTAAYFLGFCLMQVPVGVLLDRFGPGPVQGFLLSIAAVGVCCFAIGENLWLLVAARGMIGVGLAGALMAAFHASALWVSKSRLPFANGCFLAVGGLGVLASTAPVELVLEWISWRQLFAAIAFLAAGVATAIFWFTPRIDVKAEAPGWIEQVRALRIIGTDPLFFRYAPMTAVCFATGTAMQGLWAGVWLREVAGFDREIAAVYLTMMAVALTVGSVGGGWLSVALNRFGFGVKHIIVGATVVFMASQLVLVVGPAAETAVVWIIFALTYNVITLSYSILAQHFCWELVGRANSLLNAVVVGTTFLVQYGFGIAIALWPSDPGGRVPEIAFRAALGVLFMAQLACFIWLLVTGRGVAKESN
jgi:MFS family permease